MKSENGGAGHVIGAMLERFREKEPPVPGENEFIGENGLLFCSVCRTPKQCRVNSHRPDGRLKRNCWQRQHIRLFFFKIGTTPTACTHSEIAGVELFQLFCGCFLCFLYVNHEAAPFRSYSLSYLFR